MCVAPQSIRMPFMTVASELMARSVPVSSCSPVDVGKVEDINCTKASAADGFAGARSGFATG